MSRATDDSSPRRGQGLHAVVLAGGRGRRLAPYTSVLPKPLMPIGERSILELVVNQLSRAGFTTVTLCVGYLSHLIQAVLDQSEDHSTMNGVPRAQIRYVHEPEPLGTAGPLRLVDRLDGTFLVMNGDLLTTLDYARFMRHHRASGNLLTIATHVREIEIDYGVVYLNGDTRSPLVSAYEEKPRLTSNVSMGIYALEPRVLDLIPDRGHFDFPDLIQRLLAKGERVGAYRYKGLWLDIGRHDDYEQALEAWEENKHLLAPAHEIASE